MGRVEVEAGGSGDGSFVDGVAHGVGVEVRRGGEGLYGGGDQGVFVAVDGGVDAQREDVLVVHGEDAGVDDGAPGDGGVGVDGLRGDDAGGADFVGEFAVLGEDEGEDILVVGDGDDGLEDELAGARDGSQARAVVGVFPADAGVLFVDADDVVHWEGVARVVGDEGREVVDAAQAVAAEFEVVGHDAGAGVAEVEGGFAVEGGAGVGVGDVHVGEGEAVEEGAVVVADVIEDHAFTLVEAVAEGPLLPVDCVTGLAGWGDGKAGALRLDYVEGFDVGSQFLVFGGVFISLGIAEWAALLEFFASASWETVDADDFLGDGVHDGRNWKRERIVIPILIIRIGWIAHVQESLEHPLVVIVTIGACSLN